jgi:Tfp pilus assembly protein PilE
MGQQQLMLLLIVTVIVAIMTIVAINLFSDSRDEGIKDVIRQDVFEAATIGQMYYKKHPMLGGGGGSFVDITLDDIQLDTATVITTYEISETAVNYFKLTATPLSGLDPLIAVVYSDRLVWE